MPHAFRLATRCTGIVLVCLLATAGPLHAQAACTEVAAGLERPLGITRSNLGNLIVSESGTPTSNTGRLTIVGPTGEWRTLLDGLPSGINDVGDPSGPAGLFMRGRTLYVVIGIGDAAFPGGVPNPAPSSPLFRSVLALHFSAAVEQRTVGFSLTAQDQAAIAAGGTVTLSKSNGESLRVELAGRAPGTAADFRNPFDVVVAGDRAYVADGAGNMVWQIDLATKSSSVLATFPAVPNPLFGIVGPPMVEAVPTGIAYAGGTLLVTLFRGVPFPPGTSAVEAVDPKTGQHAPVVTGLKTAIDVLEAKWRNDTGYLVLQNASVGPFFNGPGLLLRTYPDGSRMTVASCLERPTSMAFDEHAGLAYVTELLTGRVVAVAVAP